MRVCSEAETGYTLVLHGGSDDHDAVPRKAALGSAFAFVRLTVLHGEIKGSNDQRGLRNMTSLDDG